MKVKCLDIGTLQGFVDGELTNPETEKVIRHLALCEECPTALADLEAQNELVFSALDADYNVMVPTERLRAKVFQSIREIESGDSSSFWPKWLAVPKQFLLQPGFATVAGLLLFAAMFSIGYRFLSGTGTEGLVSAVKVNVEPVDSVADVNAEVVATTVNESNSGIKDVAESSQPPVVNPRKTRQHAVRPSPAVYRKRSGQGMRIVNTTKTSTVEVEPESANLDAEEGYLTTIATLSRTVNQNKDYVLRPSERVDYERNLAVVDDAIRKMKGEVRIDPNNNAAREVLRSSYKNKIDLLSSVADRAETVASLN